MIVAVHIFLAAFLLFLALALMPPPHGTRRKGGRR